MKSGFLPETSLDSSSVKQSQPWRVLKWYLIQTGVPSSFTHWKVWEPKPSWWREVFGVPRSPMRYATWCADSGVRVQKSHCMSASRRPFLPRRFWEWMKSGNFIASRMKNTGVLLPTMS